MSRSTLPGPYDALGGLAPGESLAMLAPSAGVAELADAAGLGPVGLRPLEVQVLSPASGSGSRRAGVNVAAVGHVRLWRLCRGRNQNRGSSVEDTAIDRRRGVYREHPLDHPDHRDRARPARISRARRLVGR